MSKTKHKHVRIGLRLTPGEATQLEAISHRLGVTKSDVLRLSLSARSSMESANPDAGLKAVSSALDAVLLRLDSVSDRLQNIETLQGNSVDLLLSVSRASQPSPSRGEPPTKPQNQPAGRGPAWSEYFKKNPKINPIMSDAAWLDFLKKRYQETHGHPPDLTA